MSPLSPPSALEGPRPPEAPLRLWEHLTSPEAREWLERDPVLVLPLAAVEQHGPHLPLSTDLEITLGLLRRAFRELPDDAPVFVLPPQAVGASPEHLGLAGTLSLEPGTLADLVESVGSALAGHGLRRLVLFNGHGGNRHLLEAPALRLRARFGMLVVKATYTRFGRPPWVALPDSEWAHGLHGGALETAMMLHLRPDLVRKDRIARQPSLGEALAGTLDRLGPEGEASFAWRAGDLNPSGAVGDPTLASPSMGKALVDHYGTVLAQVLQDALAFPLERLGEADAR